VENGAILFNPTITTKNNLAKCFRIFIDPTKISNKPAKRYQDPGTNARHPLIEVFTDGACYHNGKLNTRSGSRVWYGPNNKRNLAIRVPGNSQSNQVGEVVVIIAVVNATPPFQPLAISTDSKYVINGLTTHLGQWENQGWIGIKNAPLFKKVSHLLRLHTAPTTFKWVKGHNGNKGNEGSDKLVKEGANKDKEDHINLTISDEFNVQGPKLNTLTQAIAYRGIKESRKTPTRQTTKENLQKTCDAIHKYTGSLEMDKTIWLSIRKQEIQTKIRQFLFKTMHGTQKIGKFWTTIATLTHREQCRACDTTKTMEHILTRCRKPPI